MCSPNQWRWKQINSETSWKNTTPEVCKSSVKGETLHKEREEQNGRKAKIPLFGLYHRALALVDLLLCHLNQLLSRRRNLVAGVGGGRQIWLLLLWRERGMGDGGRRWAALPETFFHFKICWSIYQNLSSYGWSTKTDRIRGWCNFDAVSCLWV